MTKFADVEPAVNRQPGFRRELVEQNQHRNPIIDALHWDLFNSKYVNEDEFPYIFF